VKITINNPQVAIEEHEGDRSINDDHWWMEWPDFVFRSDACHKRGNKLNNIAKKHHDAMSQEQFELLDGDSFILPALCAK
jgi:hypothetical protein